MQGWSGPLPKADVRNIEDMYDVLRSPDCQETGPLYFMYRDLALTPSDRRWLRSHQVRYDITAILPRDLCGERAKTKGHYHPEAPSGPGYPEMYEVIAGHAHYLLQDRSLSDVVLVDAHAQDIVVVPPGYGHVTINAGDAELVMANLVSSAFLSEYGEYEKRRGAAYYERTDGTFLQNPSYTPAADLRRISAGKIRGLLDAPSGSIYALVGTDRLSFLNHPEKAAGLFREVLED